MQLQDNFYELYKHLKDDDGITHLSTDIEDIRRIYFYIRNLAGNHDGKELTIVELGTCFGVTTTLMAQAIVDRNCSDISKFKIISVDINKERSDFARALSSKYGFGDIIEYMTGDAITLIEQLSNYYNVEFWYVDDHHEENHVYKELGILNSVAKSGTIIVCHDYRPDTLDGVGVIKGFNRWYKSAGDNWSIPSFSCGCLIWTQKL